MKRHFSLSRAIGLILILTASACGQRGPLYLPTHPDAPRTAPAKQSPEQSQTPINSNIPPAK